MHGLQRRVQVPRGGAPRGVQHVPAAQQGKDLVEQRLRFHLLLAEVVGAGPEEILQLFLRGPGHQPLHGTLENGHEAVLVELEHPL